MKSILIGLLFTALIRSCPCYCQTDIRFQSSDSVYCLPLGKARQLVSAALRAKINDSILVNLESRIFLLESEKLSVHQSFTNLLKISEQKFEKQKEITSDFVRLSDSWRDQSEYYRKKERKARGKNKVLTIVVLILTGAVIIK